GGMHGAPAVAREIQADEEIARKQRPLHQLLTARVPAPARIARQIGRKPLAAQVQVSPPLAVRLRVHHIPALFAHAASPDGARAGMCTRRIAGPYTRSAAKTRNAASNAPRGSRSAVTTTASAGATARSPLSRIASPSAAITPTISTGCSRATRLAISARSP